VTCPITGEPLRDNQTISTTALNAIEQALAEIDWLLEDLDVVLSKQAKARPAGAGERDDRPLPYNVGASEAADALHRCLASWAAMSSEDHGIPYSGGSSTQDIASYLMGHMAWFGAHYAGHEAYTEITDAVNRIRAVIDLDPRREYLGPCGGVMEGIECTDEVWLVEGDDGSKPAFTSCKTCGTSWEVIPRRIDQVVRANGVTASVITLTRAFTDKIGLALPRTTIDSWVKRGLLRPTYPGSRMYDMAHVGHLVKQARAGEKLSAIEEEQAG
jgi:hypothetical protein